MTALFHRRTDGHKNVTLVGHVDPQFRIVKMPDGTISTCIITIAGPRGQYEIVLSDAEAKRLEAARREAGRPGS